MQMPLKWKTLLKGILNMNCIIILIQLLFYIVNFVYILVHTRLHVLYTDTYYRTLQIYIHITRHIVYAIIILYAAA